jgi:hypothetical protein
MMNTNAPPKAERRLCGTALRNAEPLAAYPVLPLLQVAPVENLNGAHVVITWEKEAARLFREFWRTDNQKHLCAFVRHVQAMRSHRVRRAR